MTFSALISGTVPHHGKYDKRPGSVIRVIQHHWAGTNLSGEAALASKTSKKSANYLIYNDGAIKGQVPEEFRPWTSGGMAADGRSITIEVQNESGAPDWRVSDAALWSIVRLLADIATRYGFGQVNTTNYRGHREFASTACPGPFLWARMNYIREHANDQMKNGTVTPPRPPAPKPSKKPNCRALQRAIHTDDDNSWGPDTDKHGDALREASAWGGQDFPYGVKFAQHVVGTREDGDWGPKSVRAHDATVKAVQDALRAMGFDPGPSDGKWGPRTEGAYQAARRACRV